LGEVINQSGEGTESSERTRGCRGVILEITSKAVKRSRPKAQEREARLQGILYFTKKALPSVGGSRDS